MYGISSQYKTNEHGTMHTSGFDVPVTFTGADNANFKSLNPQKLHSDQMLQYLPCSPF